MLPGHMQFRICRRIRKSEPADAARCERAPRSPASSARASSRRIEEPLRHHPALTRALACAVRRVAHGSESCAFLQAPRESNRRRAGPCSHTSTTHGGKSTMTLTRRHRRHGMLAAIFAVATAGLVATDILAGMTETASAHPVRGCHTKTYPGFSVHHLHLYLSDPAVTVCKAYKSIGGGKYQGLLQDQRPRRSQTGSSHQRRNTRPHVFRERRNRHDQGPASGAAHLLQDLPSKWRGFRPLAVTPPRIALRPRR